MTYIHLSLTHLPIDRSITPARRLRGYFFLQKNNSTNKEASIVLCSVVMHLGSGRALKKKEETLDYVSCFPPRLLSCSTASCVLYKRTKHSRGFFICKIQDTLAVLRQFAVCSPRINLRSLCPKQCCFDVDKTFDIVLVTVENCHYQIENYI